MTAQETDAHQLSQVTLNDEVLSLTWGDGRASEFHHIWLRDNCRCDDCGCPTDGRRTFRIQQTPMDIRPTVAHIDDDGELAVTWPDGHETRFTGTFLRENAYDDEARRDRCFIPKVWNDEFRAEPPVMPFAKVESEDVAFLEMLHTIRDYGFCFLSDIPVEADRLEPFAQKIGPIQESNFGRVQDLTVDFSKKDVAHRANALPPHTDEPYRASPPGILLFHCINTDIHGTGSSTFVDGFEAAETVRTEDPEGFAALTRNRHPFRRHFVDDVDLVAEFPVVSTDEFGNIIGVRINHRVAAPLRIPPKDVTAYYRGLRRLLELVEDENNMIKLTLKPGDGAVFDNHRVLHGRTDLTINGKRWLQWIQVERGDFHSIMRITADRLQRPRDAKPLLRGAYS